MRLIDKDELNKRLNTGMDVIEMMQTIIDMPVVPERTGRWYRNRAQSPWPICSECGVYGANESNYCPNCGAKMEVQQ